MILGPLAVGQEEQDDDEGECQQSNNLEGFLGHGYEHEGTIARVGEKWDAGLRMNADEAVKAMKWAEHEKNEGDECRDDDPARCCSCVTAVVAHCLFPSSRSLFICGLSTKEDTRSSPRVGEFEPLWS